MKKKILAQDLLNNNYQIDKYHNFTKLFNNYLINVSIQSNLFGKVNVVRIFYKFKNKLEEEFHDDVWKKLETLFKNTSGNYVLGSLGFEYFEVCILDKNTINNINVGTITNNCNIFSSEIEPIIKEFNL